MTNAEQGSVASSELRDEITEKLSCPVCFQVYDDLGLLNNHLDKDHGFGGPPATTAGKSDKRAQKKHNKQERVTKDHFKPFQIGSSKCQECNQQLKKGDEARNCTKCGELFCKKHCQNMMKLNAKGQYDPTKGKWRVCCYKCFSERPGYNDFGSVRELTSSFKRLRNLNNEDKHLQVLHLENRLVRLIDGITDILQSHEESILRNFMVNSEAARYEQTVTSWRRDKDVSHCSVCGQQFALLLRKHHCRLCGNIVCDDERTNCSNRVPIPNLVNDADDIQFRNPREDLIKQSFSIRVCSSCTHKLYYGRKFNKDRVQPLSPLLSQCNRIQNVSISILNLMSLLASHSERVEKQRDTQPSQAPAQHINETTKLKARLLRAVASYTQLAKSIASLEPKNNAERKIQQSVKMASSIFINEKIVHMKSLSIPTSPEASDTVGQVDPPLVKPFRLVYNNLSIREVKQYREELMVLKEQKFLVESMIDNAKKQRNFDEITTLSSNLHELEARINSIQECLGDQGFA